MSSIAAVTPTVLGFAGVALGPEGIVAATLFHPTEAAALGELRAAGASEGTHPLADGALARLRSYAQGEGDVLSDFPVCLGHGSDLQRRTWLALRTIPYGETRSYGWLAERLGVPGKARVIGSFNGANPIPLWLPCHRVIGADGTLVGFGGGLAMKRQLLELEGALPRSMF